MSKQVFQPSNAWRRDSVTNRLERAAEETPLPESDTSGSTEVLDHSLLDTQRPDDQVNSNDDDLVNRAEHDAQNLVQGELDTASDSDTSGDDMANTLLPDHFRGLDTEDAVAWMRDLEHWGAFKNMNNEKILGLMPLLLKDGARLWFDALHNDIRGDFRRVREAFLEQYRRDRATRWRDAASVWATTQQPHQSVDSYLTDIQKKAMKTAMTDEQLRFSVIHGLRPDIRQMVVQHDPETLADVTRWAKIAESSRMEDASSTGVDSLLRKLEERLDQIQIREVGSTNPSAERRGSVSPARRVSFASDTTAPATRSPSLVRRSFSSVGTNYGGQGGSDRENFGRNGPGQSWSYGRRQRMGNNRGGQQNGGRQYSNQGHNEGQCFRCGRNHGNFQNCRATNLRCYGCGRIGHVVSVCRSVRNVNNSH